jgi:hypothetical protein
MRSTGTTSTFDGGLVTKKDSFWKIVEPSS